MIFIHELGIRESVLNQPVFMVSDRLGFNGHFKLVRSHSTMPFRHRVTWSWCCNLAAGSSRDQQATRRWQVVAPRPSESKLVVNLLNK